MATDYLLPKAKDLTAAFGMLYGDGVDVKDGEPKPLSENKLYGLFVNSEGDPVAATMCDASFAAYAGSALMMLPPGAAEEAAETGDLTPVMEENVYELINICSRLFMGDNTPHLKLDKMYSDPGELPEKAREMIANAEGANGFGVEFPRYGAGNISFVTT